MNYYVDIQVLPSKEFSDSILMNELFTNLHIALVLHGEGEIGVSFPRVNKTLGEHIRLHGNQLSLKRLMDAGWINRLKDYVKVSDIIPIPNSVTYRVVTRMQSKSNSERLKRRSVKKGWLTKEEADRMISEKNEKKLDLPYIKIKSKSSGQFFRLFIEHGPEMNVSIEGSFSAYGLSSNATIPWF